MRHLTIFVFALMIACSRAPAPVHQDAGAPVRAPDAGAPPVQHAPEPDPTSAMASNGSHTSRPRHRGSDFYSNPRNYAAKHPANAVNPYVARCIANDYSDGWAGINSCLRGVDAPTQDAGISHKLGAAVRPPNPSPAILVPDWYINPSTGSNSNTCVTSGAPCKSNSEIFSRLGTNAATNTVVTSLHELADNVATDPVDWQPTIALGAGAFVIGSTTILCSGTLASVVSKNQSAGIADGRLHADLGACAGAAQGFIIRNTSRSNTVAFVDQCSGSVCALTQPTSENATTLQVYPALPEDDGWANGNAFSIVRPTIVYVSQFLPNAYANGVLSDTSEAAIINVWVPDQQTLGVDCSTLNISHDASVIESRVDSYVQFVDATIGNEGNLLNTWASCGGQFHNAAVRFGASNTLNSGNIVSSFSGILGNDIVLHGLNSVGERESDATVISTVYDDGDLEPYADVEFFGDQALSGIIYGTYTIGSGEFSGATAFLYNAPAIAAFAGVPTFSWCAGPPDFGSAYDASRTPGQWLPARSLTPTSLDLSIAAGGFGGTAKCASGFTVTTGQEVTSAPAAYVTPVANGGTGRDAGCPDGSVYEGTGASTPPTCEYIVFPDAAVPTTVSAGTAITVTGTPPNYVVNNSDPGANVSVVAGSNISSVTHVGEAWTVNAATQSGAVSGVTGSSGVACSPTTGAVNCTNTGVTSLTAGSGISVSASTGGVTVSNTALFTNNVPSGATGFTSCAAGDFVQGNGTSPLQCTNIAQYDALFSGGSGVLHGTAPGSVAGQPLISGSTGTYPFFSTLGANGGGTGLNSSGASGNVLTSNGSTWVSQAAPVQLGGFIDYVTNTLSGVNTALQTVASVAESITYPRPVIIDVSWICYDGIENNGIVVGVNVDNNTSIPGSYQLNGGLGADLTGHGAGSNGSVFMSQHIYFGGLSTASHTFYFMAATSSTSLYAVSCTAQAVLHF